MQEYTSEVQRKTSLFKHFNTAANNISGGDRGLRRISRGCAGGGGGGSAFSAASSHEDSAHEAAQHQQEAGTRGCKH